MSATERTCSKTAAIVERHQQARVSGMHEKGIAGWGVVRVQPWHLAGIFETQAEALRRMKELSPSYIVRFGSGFPRSHDFFWEMQERAD